ncbi:hypothetical protein ABQX22_09035 [Xanthomonas sp. WHRI 1810A]|uniref:hypothetical protein n=1 Tax=Xanthomonas sp. WHRI 1810A TaxID=3161565 RepID=UPI0032E89167
MTLPMAIGVSMTIACILTCKLKSRVWRKWLGLAMAVSGAIGAFKFSWSDGPYFVVVWMFMFTGWDLFAGRDHFTTTREE